MPFIWEHYSAVIFKDAPNRQISPLALLYWMVLMQLPCDSSFSIWRKWKSPWWNFLFFPPFFWQFPPKDMNKLLKFSLGVMVPKAGRPRGPSLLVNGSLGFQFRSTAEWGPLSPVPAENIVLSIYKKSLLFQTLESSQMMAGFQLFFHLAVDKLWGKKLNFQAFTLKIFF